MVHSNKRASEYGFHVIKKLVLMTVYISWFQEKCKKNDENVTYSSAYCWNYV